jgi:hypothetical protein
MAVTLASYLSEVRRLLHDANANYWSDAELTDYINDGRSRTVVDTGCNRILQSISVSQGQEVLNYATFPQGLNTADVLNVTLLWGNARIVLGQMTFSEFNVKFRTYINLQSRPVSFARYGQSSLYIGPIPDQTYQVELDTICVPVALSTAVPGTSDQETALVYPYTTPVAFYASYKAKYKEQSFVEAQTYHDEYIKKCKEALVQTMTRSIPSLYTSL